MSPPRVTRPFRHPFRQTVARLWVLMLLDRFDCELEDLSRQLTLPPEGRAFAFGIEPLPLTDRMGANRVFERIMELGTDPSGYYFGRGAERYCLAERVESYAPGSRSWLLEELEPYLSDDLPPIGKALTLGFSVMDRLGVFRLNQCAILGLRRIIPDQVDELVCKQVAAMSQAESPHHLALLVLTLHEIAWHRPRSARARAIGNAVLCSIDNLAKRKVFHRHAVGESVRDELYAVLIAIVQRTMLEGPRSAKVPELHRFGGERPLFARRFDGHAEAEACIGKYACIPLGETVATANRYMRGDLPTEAEVRAATMDLLANVAFDATEIEKCSRSDLGGAQLL